ncbi:Alpha-xylosidase [compost metagenome]
MHHASGELLARWTQLGVFTPFCRNHSAIDTRNQEPWTFNDEVEEICQKYIEFRYRMLPYLYSLFYESTCTGLPIMRPLVLEYPKDRNTYHLSDQFLLGKDLLVAPIYEPGKQHRVVYLPEGIWFDYWTGTRYEGGAHIIAHAPLDVLPLYIRAGAILPQTQLMQHTGQAIWQELDIHLYTQGVTSAFTLYEDDGLSDRYAQGAYNLIQISTEENDRRYTISAAYKVCGLQQDDKSILFTVHHLSFIPKSVSLISEVHEMKHLEERSSGWYYDKQDDHLYIKTQLADLQEVELIVEG